MSGSTYEVGVNRIIVLATETTFGVAASGPGQILRRTNFSMDKQPPEAQSAEINPDAQMVDSHLGMPMVSGSLSGQLSPGSYKEIFEGLFRGTWTAGVTAAGISDSTLSIGGDGTLTLGSTATNFLTALFKKGDVARLSGVTATPATINATNLLITNVAAAAITMAPNAAAVAWVSGQSAVALTVVGKKLIVPNQGSQVDRSYSIEDWQSDSSKSHLGTGIKFGQVALNVQPNGYVNMQVAFTGKNRYDTGVRVYATPTGASTSIGVRSVAGKVIYQGAVIGYVTGFSVQISQALQPAVTIGAIDGTVKIAAGMILVRGSIQVLATSDTMTADFLDEVDVEVALFIPTSTAGNADFVNAYIPRTRLLSNQRQDSDRLLMRSYTLGGLQKVSGGAGTAFDRTTITMQDSLA